MVDPIQRLALYRDKEDSSNLERQIGEMRGGGPVVTIYRALRLQAAEALAAMAFIDIRQKPTQVRRDLMALQAEVKRFDDFVAQLKQMVARGSQAEQVLEHDEREDLLDILLQSPGGEETAIRLGLVNEAHHDA